MDVSCPRCKTEYEFDDARVPDSGVTVKCTSCNHVFRVRKKSAPAAALAAPPPPAKVGDETLPARSPQLQASGTREWKVRQPSGNIFSFKELTTLQKWIVERKVSRDDEISLTGEAWKRLGNIAELASFFQIVDDAKKVHELEALQQMKDKLSTQPGVEPASSAPPPPPDESAPRLAAHPAPGERAGVQPRIHEAPTEPPEDAKKKLTETLREPGFTTLPPRPLPEASPQYKPPPLPVQQRREVLPDVEAETLRPAKTGGGAGMVLGLLLVLAGLGGAAGYYFVVWVPEQQRAQEARAIEEKAKAEAAAKLAEEEARKAAERLEAEKKAQEAAEAEKKRQEEEAAKAAAAAVPDAGAAVAKKGNDGEDKPEKGEKAEKGEKKEPKRNADYWIGQGDRLRDKERAEAALDAYGKALDLSPENVEALTGKGLCLLDMAKPLQAEPVLEHALKLNPRYAPAIMGLAESYRFQGKKDSAVATYQKYLDAFPNGPEAGVAKANIERLK
jgi:predicted Zn finger-like uncharacterized protein